MRQNLKWVFQMFFGINIINAEFHKIRQKIVNALKDIHLKILKYLSGRTYEIYTSCEAIGLSMWDKKQQYAAFSPSFCVKVICSCC